MTTVVVMTVVMKIVDADGRCGDDDNDESRGGGGDNMLLNC